MTAFGAWVNGKRIEVDVADETRLLDLLRDELGLTGTKEGCGIGECGACTVLLDGEAVNACLVLAVQVRERRVETVEGLVAEDGTLSRLQAAFLDGGAVQCGFCTPGMLMSAEALLRSGAKITPATVRLGLSGNLCRCTGYQPIVDAVLDASQRRAEGALGPTAASSECPESDGAGTEGGSRAQAR